MVGGKCSHHCASPAPILCFITNNCLISSIGAFYYTLGNIQPQNRSHMNAIQLLGLVHNKHIKKYGIEPILEAFLTDLDLLERVTLHDFFLLGQYDIDSISLMPSSSDK